MIYRNDQDAALARLEALEAENAKLEAENAKLRQPAESALEAAEHTFRKNRRRAAIAVGMAALVVSSAVAALALATTSNPASPPSTDKLERNLRPLHVEIADIDACLNKMVVDPYLDADAADPRAHGHDAARLVESSTDCRALVDDRLLMDDISDPERRALRSWQSADDNLQPVISLVVTYYDADPYALDNYATAPQLWREYNRTLSPRNAAIVEWRHATH